VYREPPRERTGSNAVRATIRSGLEAGLTEPHVDLPDRERNPSELAERETAKQDPTARQHSWRAGMVTARELQTKQFKPVRIILPDLIPEGVTLVVGKPKVGKSWLALDVCLAVADENRFVLGDKRPVHGNALYLALEDNERRLKNRIDKILQGGSAPARLELHTEWKRMDQGGLEDIEAWITSAEDPRVIWIDTLAKLRALPKPGEPPYAADYRSIEGVQKLAGKYGVGVIFNTHLRKAPSEDDPFDEVSGTLGLTGAADTIIVMKRHSGMVKLHVRGRDIEEGEFAAEFNRNTCRWRLVGGADEIFRSQERQAILAVLKDTVRPMSIPEIMAATERSDRHAIYNLLYKMEKAGEIKHAGRGALGTP
jgi:AAA domain